MAQHFRTEDQNDRRYEERLFVKRLAALEMTPHKLAQLADLSPHLVDQALSGKCKKIETLWAISQVLGVKWETLFKFHQAADDVAR